jgi:hypothetical protein
MVARSLERERKLNALLFAHEAETDCHERAIVIATHFVTAIKFVVQPITDAINRKVVTDVGDE